MIGLRRDSLRVGLLVVLAACMTWSAGWAKTSGPKFGRAVKQEAAFQGVLTGFDGWNAFFVDDTIRVRTYWGTMFSGIASVDELDVGDVVYIEGWYQGDEVQADLVMLVTQGDQSVVLDGTLSWFVDQWTFVLDGETTVTVDEMTTFDGFFWLGELSPGDSIHVEGSWWGDVVLADLVRRTDDPGHEVSVEGEVTWVISSTDFMLDDEITVVTNSQTMFFGIDGVDDLEIGDTVDVEGTASLDGRIIADSVELVSTGDDSEELSGIVASIINSHRFLLEGGTTVVTDGWTAFFGIDGVEDLRPGDEVDLWGWWSEGFFLAESVELVSSTPEPVEVTGLVAYLEPPDAFVLDDQTWISVTGDTQWIGLDGYGDLVVGDALRIRGVPDEFGWGLVAIEIERTQDPEATWITREGWIEQVVSSSTVRLNDGTVLEIRPDAELVDVDAVENLLPGDRVWIGAWTTDDPAVLDVVRLELRERAGSPVDFVSVVQRVDLVNDLFLTSNGYVVFVGNETVFVNVTDLSGISEGDWVAVTGIAGTDPRYPDRVEATRVEWRQGEDDGGGDGDNGGGVRTVIEGLVTELRADGVFEIDHDLVVRTTHATEWRGTLEGFNDLVLQFPVRAEVSLESDQTMPAVWVEGFDAVAWGIREIEGYVLEVDVSVSRLRLETGEWVGWDDYTQIDGDAADFNEIEPGMHLLITAVDLGEGNFLAFEILAELEITDVDALGFSDGPIRETLVVLRDGAVASTVAERHGAVVTGTLPGLLVSLFSWSEDVGIDALQELLDDEDVEILEPNRSFTDPESAPDSIRRRAIAIDREASSDDFNNQDALFKADLATAHSRSFGEGTLVAVIDTGIDPFHPLLRHRIASGGYDFVDDDAMPWETSDGIDQDGDDEIDESAGHGTFVAGLVLLAAPSTSILPFRVLDDDGRGSTFDISRAVLLAIDRGADVINMSFTYPERSRILDRILMEASERGVILVAGAGNGGRPELPFPAVDNRVLAVAAVDTQGLLADFSNRGVDVAIAAPGVDLYSAGLDAQFGVWSGTSMAAPLVSGTAALMRSLNPHLTPQQVAAALFQGASEASEEDDIRLILQAGHAITLIPNAP